VIAMVVEMPRVPGSLAATLRQGFSASEILIEIRRLKNVCLDGQQVSDVQLEIDLVLQMARQVEVPSGQLETKGNPPCRASKPPECCGQREAVAGDGMNRERHHPGSQQHRKLGRDGETVASRCCASFLMGIGGILTRYSSPFKVKSDRVMPLQFGTTPASCAYEVSERAAPKDSCGTRNHAAWPSRTTVQDRIGVPRALRTFPRVELLTWCGYVASCHRHTEIVWPDCCVLPHTDPTSRTPYCTWVIKPRAVFEARVEVL